MARCISWEQQYTQSPAPVAASLEVDELGDVEWGEPDEDEGAAVALEVT